MRPDPLPSLVPSIVTGTAVLDMNEEPDAEVADEHRGEHRDGRDRRVSGEKPGEGEQDRQAERDEPEQSPLEPSAQPADRDQGNQRTDCEATEGQLGEQLEVMQRVAGVGKRSLALLGGALDGSGGWIEVAHGVFPSSRWPINPEVTASSTSSAASTSMTRFRVS
jgi:hypothetical protein